MIHKDYCSRCGRRDVPLVKQSKTTTTQYYWCRSCTNKKMRDYRKTDRGREVIQQIKDRMKIKYPQKEQARKIVNYAILIGYLIKPKNCVGCDRDVRLQAHHPDYDKALEIIWLCTSCHALLHNINK